MKYFIYILASLLFFSSKLFSQAGITVSPGKIYFKSAPGETTVQKIFVSNPNNRELQLGISISDWGYDPEGNNMIHVSNSQKNSCADWIEVLPGSYFTLEGKEQKEVSISVTAPKEVKTDVNMHTAMIFLTQLNPGDAKREDGTTIKVSVRMGVKVYHSFPGPEIKGMEIINFIDKIDPVKKDLPGYLEAEVENSGNIWLDGNIKLELLNTQTGKKEKFQNIEFYTLPGDKRIIKMPLPEKLDKGTYNATLIVSYGNKDELKVAELEFER